MDANRFDRLAKSLTACTSRRGAIATFFGGLLAPLLPVDESVAKPGKGRKNRHGRRQGSDRERGGPKNKRNDRGKHKRDRQPRRANAEQSVPRSCFSGSPCIPGKGAYLTKCDFGGSTALKQVNCTGCNLSSANMRGADASGANFTKANLQQACLVDANLSGATIASSTNVSGATFCRTVMPNGTINNSGCSKGTNCCPTCVDVDRTGCSLGGSCCGGAVCQPTADGRGVCRCPASKPNLCNGACQACCGDQHCSGATPRCCADNTCKGCCGNAQCQSGVCCNGACCAAGNVCDTRQNPDRCCPLIPKETACANRCGAGISDGCGGAYDCGGCTAPDSCGGGGVPNVCGCTPTCGTRTCGDNGCGGVCGTCGAGQTCCSGTCKLATGSDCSTGGDAACCSGVCVDGVCQAACSGENDPCDGAADCCAGTTCVDTGRIGVCCASGVACSAACCASSDEVCADNGACCAPDSRATTCAGRCGVVIDNCDQEVDCGQPCSGVSPACCDTFCTDLNDNLLHCGDCAITCVDGTRGSPACCDGACTDLLSDLQHCGSCDADPCTAGTTPACCAGACADLDSNSEHCGACFARCQVGSVPNATAVACTGARCVATACQTGYTVVSGDCCLDTRLCGSMPNLTCCSLGQTCCSAICTDTSLDPNNCGGCGRPCPAGVSCAGGVCSQGSFGETCGGSVQCSYTNDCTGNSCLNGRCCIPGGVECVKGQITFNGACCCNPSLSCPDVGVCPSAPA